MDNNISPENRAAIDHFLAPRGSQITAKRGKFGDPKIEDIEWIQTLDAEGGWSFIALDTHIRRRPAELAVLRRTKVTAFFLQPAWQRFTPVEQAGQLMLWWPKLEAAFETNRPGTTFSLPWRMSSTLRRLPA